MPIVLAHPWWLLALSLIVPLLWLTRKTGTSASITYSAVSLLGDLGKKPKVLPGALSLVFMSMAIACAVIGLARPQWTDYYAERKASGIDIILAIDISYSMEISDFQIDNHSVQRITAAKATAEKFITQRPNDRMGIVAFSGRPYVISPITLEHDWLVEQLRELQPGLVKEQGTAIGSAIAAATTRLHDRKAKSKIVVLVTDGSNNSGRLAPKEAAEYAAKLGVKIYTIAIGSEGGRLYNGRQAFAKQEFDTTTLEEISKITNGEYYRVHNTDKLEETFQSIDLLEKTDSTHHKTISTTELFPWCAGASLLFVLLSLTLQTIKPAPGP